MRQRTVNLIYLILFLLLLAAPTVIRRLYFYGLGGGDRSDVPIYEVADVPGRVPTPSAGEFSDEPDVGEGLILLDAAHDNEFDLSEINYLDSRLAARGFELISYRGGGLADALRQADAFIVIAPLVPFDLDEVQVVSEFVRRGGRLLMVGDPTRFVFDFDDEESFELSLDTDEIPLNSLANEFDLIFNGDYLYNTLENEGNFRNILLKRENFAEDTLTEQVSQLAFYGSHSIQVGGEGQPLLTGDDNTWSSATDRPGGLVLAAFGSSDGVLAVGDLDFLAEPYYTVFDNSRFIAHIADFLTDTDRDYALEEFPYFFGDEIDLVFVGQPDLGPDAFDEIIGWQEAFKATGRRLSLMAEPTPGHDVMHVGIYNQAEELTPTLEEAGIALVIDPPIETDEKKAGDEVSDEASGEVSGENAEAEESAEEIEPADDAIEVDLVRRIVSDLGNVQMSGTSLIMLQNANDNWELIILAASGDGLESVIQRLIDMIPIGTDNGLSDCLVQDFLALCPTGVDVEPVEAELETGGAPEVEDAEEGETGEEEGDEGEIGEEPSEEEGEPEGNGDEGETGQYLEEYDAYLQGSIEVGETVEATLEADQAHAWTLDAETIVIDIFLEVSEEMDGVLELYDSQGEFVSFSDSGVAGEEEQIEFIELSDEGPYTIVAREWEGLGGDYTLTVETVTIESLGAEIQGELVFGEPASGSILEEEFHAWTFNVDEQVEINLTLQTSEDMDGILVLFNPDFLLLERADDTLEGGEERLEGILLEQTGEYVVVVAAFGFGAGDYTLLLEEA